MGATEHIELVSAIDEALMNADLMTAIDEATSTVDLMGAIDEAVMHVDLMSAIDEAVAHVEGLNSSNTMLYTAGGLLLAFGAVAVGLKGKQSFNKDDHFESLLN